MADQIRATPRSPILGLFSDLVNLPLQYMSSPERTQQMQGTAQFLYGTGIPKTLERASYGESLFSGAGMTLRPKEETINAAMNVAPFAPVAGRVAGRMIKATEGMPVGMGIKPINLNQGIYKPELTMEEMLKVKDIPTVDRVRQSIDLVGEKEFERMVNAQYSKYKPSDVDQEAMLVESVTLDILGKAQRNVEKSNINVQLNQGSNFLSAKSEFGQVGGTIRQPDRLSDTPYLQINYAEVEKASRGKGKGKELYQALIDEAQTRGLRVFSDSTVEKPAVNVYKSLEKGGYKLNDMTTGSLEDGTVYGAGASKPAFEIISTKSIQAPQQAALDLAQQRAALPVEQGGLGLPANNTPEMRAQAMGFDVNNPLYHATDVDFESIRPSLQGKLGAGVYVSPSSQYAEKYTSLNAAGNARVLPLVARGKLADDDVAMNIAESIRQEMATQNPNFSVSEWKKRTTKALADAGYDGRNMSGLESVITNPENVRSRFAAFDPFRKDVATAAAMGVAAPNLLAQPVNQAQPTYETIPMYTDPFGNTIGSSIR
jgi:predicted GNAT family acetyltransferase